MQDNGENPQVIFAWKAPLRPYKRRGALILRFYLAVALLISGIVFFFGDKVLLLPIWALLFLFYVLTITPPPEVEHRITEFGVETASLPLRWEALSHFYFSYRFGFHMLVLVSHPPLNYHAYLVVPNEETKRQLKHILGLKLLYIDKPRKGVTERLIDALSTLIPNDDEQTTVSTSSTPPVADEEKREEPPSPPSDDPSSEPPHQSIPDTHQAPWQEESNPSRQDYR